MYLKLSVRNAVRSFRDYLLYMGRGGDSDTRKTQFGLGGIFIIPAKMEIKLFLTHSTSTACV